MTFLICRPRRLQPNLTFKKQDYNLVAILQFLKCVENLFPVFRKTDLPGSTATRAVLWAVQYE